MSNKITPLPRYKINDIPASLRRLADEIERGEVDGETVLLCLYTETHHKDDSIQSKWNYRLFGKFISKVTASGILEIINREIWDD